MQINKEMAMDGSPTPSRIRWWANQRQTFIAYLEPEEVTRQLRTANVLQQEQTILILYKQRREEQVDALLDIFAELPRENDGKLVQVLQNTRQHHLIPLVTGRGYADIMMDFHKTQLDRNWELFGREISKPETIAEQLENKGIFTKKESENVKEKVRQTGKEEGNQILLSIIRRKGDNAYFVLYDQLRKNGQGGLSKLLLGDIGEEAYFKLKSEIQKAEAAVENADSFTDLHVKARQCHENFIKHVKEEIDQRQIIDKLEDELERAKQNANQSAKNKEQLNIRLKEEREEKDCLKKEKEDVEKEFTIEMRHNKELKSEIENLKTHMVDQEKQISASQNLQRQLDEKYMEIEGLQEKKDELQVNYLETKYKLEDLQKEHAMLKTKLGELEENVKEKDNKIFGLQEKKDELQVNYQETKYNFEDLKKEHAMLKTKLMELEENVKEKDNKIFDLAQKIGGLESTQANVETQLASNEEHRTRLEKRSEYLVTEMEQKDVQIESLTKEKKELSKKQESIEAELGSEQAKNADLQEQIDNMDPANKELGAERAERKRLQQKFDEDKAALENELKREKEKEKPRFTMDLSTLAILLVLIVAVGYTVNGIVNANLEKELKLASLNDEKRETETQLVLLRKEKTDKEEANSHIRKIQTEYIDLKQDHLKVSIDLKYCNEAKHDQKKYLSENNQDILKCKTQLDETRIELDQCSSDKEKLEIEGGALRDDRKNTTRELSVHQKLYKKCHSELEESQRQLGELQKDCRKSKEKSDLDAHVCDQWKVKLKGELEKCETARKDINVHLSDAEEEKRRIIDQYQRREEAISGECFPKIVFAVILSPVACALILLCVDAAQKQKKY